MSDTPTPLTEAQLDLYEALAQRTDDDWPGYRELAGWDMRRSDDRAQLILRAIPALVAEVRRFRELALKARRVKERLASTPEPPINQLTTDGLTRIARVAQERAVRDWPTPRVRRLDLEQRAREASERTQRMVDEGVWRATPGELIDMASRRAYRATCDEFGGCVTCGADPSQVRVGCPMCAVRAELREAVRS